MARDFAALDDLLADLRHASMRALTSGWPSIWLTASCLVGDFVLSGGELAAAVVIDAVARLLPGVLGEMKSPRRTESFGEAYEGLLDCPQYTRPAEFRGWKVPEVLLGGHHEEIKRWRRAASREKTKAYSLTRI